MININMNGTPSLTHHNAAVTSAREDLSQRNLEVASLLRRIVTVTIIINYCAPRPPPRPLTPRRLFWDSFAPVPE